MYADRITESMKVAIEETDRRRAIQERLQRGARHRAADDHQGHPRHQRPAAGRRREDRHVLVRAPGAGPRGGRQGRGRAAGRADGGRDEGRRRSSSSSSGRRRCATRSSRSGSASSSRTRRSSSRAPPSAPPRTRRCRPRSARPPIGPAPAAPARASRRSRSPRSWCCRRARSRQAARTPTRARCGVAAELFPGIRDEHDDDDGGWQARWLDRPTWDVTVTPNIRRRTGQRPNATHPRVLNGPSRAVAPR